jgi:hypothetical protein
VNGGTLVPWSEISLSPVATAAGQFALGLNAAVDLPADGTRRRIAEALGDLDDTIREIRDIAFTSHDHRTSP